MDSKHRQVQLPPRFSHLVSSPSPAQPVSTRLSNHTQSQSPFRFINERTEDFGEKEQTPLTDVSSRRVTPPHRLPGSRSPSRPSTPIPFSRQPSQCRRTPTLLLIPPRNVLLSHSTLDRLRPWIPIVLYAISSLGFVVAITIWKSEVFQGLDDLSHQLQADAHTGYAVLFLLIFITTFPPLPLYSTFIALSGYTFGPWIGAVISYFAALSGAVCVYVLSRTFFRESITRWLSHTPTIRRVVRAIEKRPKLLFMVRLAPYPYNVMNALLAASPTLTLRTYTVCTALSLFKVIIHTTIGASIHSFAGFHLHQSDSYPEGGEGGKETEEENSTLGRVSAFIGIALCIAIIAYLSWVARKAVDEELEEDLACDVEEAQTFLNQDDAERGMAECPFSTRALDTLPGQSPLRSSPIDDDYHHRGRTEDEH